MKINKNSVVFKYIKWSTEFWYGHYNDGDLPKNVFSLITRLVLTTFTLSIIIPIGCLIIIIIYSYNLIINPFKIEYIDSENDKNKSL